MDRINKKLESLEATERSVIVERKNDSFLDLYERLKALNSPLKNEREFEPHHRSSSTKTMTDSCYINNNLKKEIEQERTNTIVQDKEKEMIERQNSEKLCRKLDTKDEVEKVIEDMQKPKDTSIYHENLERKEKTKKIEIKLIHLPSMALIPLTTQVAIIHPSKQSQTRDPCQGMKGFPKNALSRGMEGHPKYTLTKEHERYLLEPCT